MHGTKYNKVTITLAVLVLVLFSILLYSFVIKPSYSGYVTKIQNQGVALTLNAILSQVQQNGYVQIPLGNQTITLINSQLITPQFCAKILQQGYNSTG